MSASLHLQQVRGEKPEVEVCQEVQTSTGLKLMISLVVLEGGAVKY